MIAPASYGDMLLIVASLGSWNRLCACAIEFLMGGGFCCIFTFFLESVDRRVLGLAA